jgi:hypothetical protein
MGTGEYLGGTGRWKREGRKEMARILANEVGIYVGVGN